MKKLTAILLAAIMVLAMLPVAAFAADSDFKMLGDGDLLDYIGPGGDVVIPDYVTSIHMGAFKGCTGLTSVVIPSSVTSIDMMAFENCTGLTSVVIPGSVTSIGIQAFKGCTSLTSVTIPGSVTYIGSMAFDNCTSLTSVRLSDGIQGIGYWAFRNCRSLTDMAIPDSVTDIVNNPFQGCKGLADEQGFVIFRGVLYGYFGDDTNVTIPGSVTSIADSALEKCRSIVSVTIPDSVTSIGRCAFSYCSSLTSVRIPNSVTNIGSFAFGRCTKLTDITIPDSVTSIESQLFDGCSSLKAIVIPDGVTTIGSQAFYGCTSLTSLTIPDSVTRIDNGVFMGCKGLADEQGFVILNGVLYVCFDESANVTVPNGVTTIDYMAFETSALKTVTIPTSVTVIDNFAFYRAPNLTDVYYTGSEAQWKQVRIWSGALGVKNPILSKTIHYNATAPAPELSVTVNGKAVQWTDAEPFIDANSRTMVPLRAVADAMGLTVDWDGDAREASFSNGSKTIYFPIDSTAARTGDGSIVQMDTAAVIVNSRTYAPIRYLAEYFGYTVGWDGATKTVSIK